MHPEALIQSAKENIMQLHIKAFVTASAVVLCTTALATGQSTQYARQGHITVEMRLLTETGVGAVIGKVVLKDTQYGLVLTPILADLPPGLHGFHVHQNPNCGPAEQDGRLVPGLAAGGHYDPFGTGRHGPPWGDGHLGDLPALFVDSSGNATHPVLAPRLRVADVKGRALIIHAGGDNYADEPHPLGGGGGRLACGLIQ